MSETTIKKLSISVMMFLDDLNLLDSLVETVGAASSNIIELGRERKDWEARKQLIEARKEMLHQLVSAAPVQFANHQGTYKDQMSDAELFQQYEAAPTNPAVITAIIERWAKAQKDAGLPLQSGDDIYYADLENGAVEHGTVHIAAYKNGHLESFSVNFDNGDFDEFVGSGFGTHFFRTEAEASTCVKQGNKN